MQIKREHIEKAEQLLLPEGQHFDEERRNFINRLESGDLMAVPGSGKTTALRAKLYCLAQNLPFDGDSGILALSHTNIAVDELKNKLRGYCPQLFSYPNFVGTIQDFVDTFLALPYYVQKYGHKVDIIDAESYVRVCEGLMRRPGAESSYLAGKMVYANDYRQVRFGFDENGDKILKQGINGNKVVIPISQKWEREGVVDAKIARMTAFLSKLKEAIMKYGVLHFDDCYYLADAYIREYPEILDILRKRFAYVFVDEAQDMQKHQLAIIDKCFNCEGVVLQRIGDPNQSIFDGFSTENCWESRNASVIKRSLRLTSEVASLVDHFTLDRGENGQGEALFVVEGNRTLQAPIKPYLVLYRYDTMNGLKEKFREIIRRSGLQNIPEAKNGFHIIGWNAEKTGNRDFRRLEDIFPEYNKKLSRPNAIPQTLSEFLHQEKHINSFDASRKTLIDAFVMVLRLQGVRATDERQYTSSKLLGYISDKDEGAQQRYKVELLECVKLLSSGLWEEAYAESKRLLIKWLDDFYGINPNDAVGTFLGDAFVAQIPIDNGPEHEDGDIPISIGTVHSVKGMTHCATMYVETSYKSKYESQYMIFQNASGRGKNRVITYESPLFKHDTTSDKSTYLMAKRMMYVGFSRPTHLLCYASDENCWSAELLEMMSNAGWKIERV